MKPASIIEFWEDEGYYRLAWSDGGEWTNNGPVWFDNMYDLADEFEAARQYETDTHLLYAEKVGQFDRHELEALLGEFVDDYDVDGIIEVATALCDDGNRYWKVYGEELNEVVKQFEKED